MEVLDYEKLCISLALRFHEEELIPEKMSFILDDDKFASDEHKLIWRSIQDLTLKGKKVDVPSVILGLGGNLKKAGGEVYIRTLYDFSEKMKIKSPDNWKSFCEVVNKAGILRHISLVNKNYAKKFEEFETLVASVNDIDSFLSNYVSEIQRGVASVESSYKPISTAVDEEMKRLEMARKGHFDILFFGWPSVEEYGFISEKSFGVIQGLQSMAKTQLALQIGFGKAIYLQENNLPGVVSINSLETSGHLLVRRLACCYVGIDSNDIKFGRLNNKQYTRYTEALEFIQNLPIEYDDRPVITTEELTWHAIAQNLRKKRVMGISDYAELFRDKGQSEELRVSSVVRNIKSITHLTSSCEILISQVNRSTLQTSTKIAGLGKSRYSGAIEHAADWLIEIWNPIQMTEAGITFKCPEGKREDRAYILIEKNKNGTMGDIEIHWNPTFTRFTDTKNPMGQLYCFGKKETKTDSCF